MGISQQVEDAMQRCYEGSLHDDMLNSFRIKAWDRFLQTGFCLKNMSPFIKKFEKLFDKDLDLVTYSNEEKENISSYILPESSNSHIVFVNGHLDKSLSNISAFEDADLYSLTEAMDFFGIYLQGRFLEGIDKEKDPFAILNTAIYSKGAFFYLPAFQKSKSPLQVIHIIDKSKAYYSPRLQIVLSDGASLDFINTYIVKEKVSKEEFFYNYLMDLSLDTKSKATLYNHHQNSSEGFIFESLRADLKGEADLKSVSVIQGKNIYQNYSVDLLETKSRVSLQGLSFLKDTELCKTDICITHAAEDCFSDQLFKAALTGESRNYFSGKIFVKPVAQQTVAYQMSQNLLLSEKAFCQSKPNLEILADDVKASHGMTATELNPDQLFYLTSRGLNPGEAKNLIVEGFCKKIIDQCKVPFLKEKMLHGL